MRDIKKHWTFDEYMAMTKAHEFNVKSQEKAHCARVTLDTDMAVDFVTHVQGLAFQTTRVAWLYGFFTEDGEAVALASYEPPQVASADGCTLLEDPREAKVGVVAELLGMQKVGMIFSHPPREAEGRKFHLTASDALMVAKAQAEAGKGSPFAVIKITATSDGQAATEAFQITDLGLEMIMRDAVSATPRKAEESTAASAPSASSSSSAVGRSLSGMVSRADEAAGPAKEEAADGEVGDGKAGAPAAEGEGDASEAVPSPYELHVDPRFTCLVEAKPAASFDVNFITVHIPIAQAAYFLNTGFPRASRMGVGPADLKKHLGSERTRKLGLEDALRDFELLVFLACEPFMEMSLPAIADAVLDPSMPLADGHKELIRTLAESAAVEPAATSG